MAIRQLLRDRNKTWLDGNLSTLNANEIVLDSGDNINVVAGGIINCNTNPGTAGDVLTVDGTGNLAWESHPLGEDYQSAEYLTGATWSTTSAVPVQVPAASFTASGISPGTFVMRYSFELNNPTGASIATLENDTLVETYATYTMNGALADFHTFSGMKVVGLAGGTYTFSVYINSVVGGQTTTIQRIRYHIYRIN